ncbi:hypothetical protein DPMN_088884 [Dreissena polymorpha]|uniref:Uncharacterized protein n=1 Tax=Dreissena polymorpha TaxID=45954 RepID=A0A9D4KX38_DREPO|nr:hypothetical protein DPMN_088884 [Dreissena polymorpha]
MMMRITMMSVMMARTIKRIKTEKSTSDRNIGLPSDPQRIPVYKNIDWTMISSIYMSTKTLNGQSDLQRAPDKKEVYLSAGGDVGNWTSNYIHVQNIEPEMDTSASDEMDLAFSLARKCEELWSRLDERYGKAEIVHQSFTRRIESFSRPTYTD